MGKSVKSPVQVILPGHVGQWCIRVLAFVLIGLNISSSLSEGPCMHTTTMRFCSASISTRQYFDCTTTSHVTRMVWMNGFDRMGSAFQTCTSNLRVFYHAMDQSSLQVSRSSPTSLGRPVESWTVVAHQCVFMIDRPHCPQCLLSGISSCVVYHHATCLLRTQWKIGASACHAFRSTGQS